MSSSDTAKQSLEEYEQHAVSGDEDFFDCCDTSLTKIDLNETEANDASSHTPTAFPAKELGPDPDVDPKTLLNPAQSARTARSNSTDSFSSTSSSGTAESINLEDFLEEKRDKQAPNTIDIDTSIRRSIPVAKREKEYAEVLKLFNLTGEEAETIQKFPGWLLKDVLLQGYVLITKKYLVFYSYLPEIDGNEALKAGPLGKKRLGILASVKTNPYKRCWAVIRKGAISWYAKPGDVYFPVGVIPFSKVIRCEVSSKNSQAFNIYTAGKTHSFLADSASNALDWVKEVRKELFSVRNRGHSSVIRIPLENIIRKYVVNAYDIARTLNIEFVTSKDQTKPIEARVDVLSVVFFTHTDSRSSIIKTLEEYTNGFENMRGVQFDATKKTIDFSKSTFGPVTEDVLDTTPPRSTHVTFGNSFSVSSLEIETDDAQSVLSKAGSTRSKRSIGRLHLVSKLHSKISEEVTSIATLPKKLVNANSKVYNETEEEAVDAEEPYYAGSIASTETDEYSDGEEASDGEGETNFVGQIRENHDNSLFRNHFGLEREASLLEYQSATLRKPGASVAWGGTLMLSNLYLCFQRENVQGGSWRMVVPLVDIVHIPEQPKDSVYLDFEVDEIYYGVIRLGFNDCAARIKVETLLKQTTEKVQRVDGQKERKETNSSLKETHESRFLQYTLLAARITATSGDGSSIRKVIPPLIFNARSNELKEAVMAKPLKSLTFAMLMIGSRGDVQPYLALSQGLIAEGHRCVIITHGEFKDWVESYGVEFREVGGDPRKLMELMITYGSVSYGFIKDALRHFKSWLKELMHDSWAAISPLNADVLIESPSSMIGIHIAEALSLPYFRAFTMPWTRTRAYPQALINPDKKKDTNYNYLTYVMFDHLVWLAISNHVNHWRKHHLKLPPTDLDLMSQEDIPFLYCVSPSILVPPLDQPDWIHTCGYWNLKDKENKEDKIDPELIKFIAKGKKLGKKLAYIGFGSIIVTDPDAMTATIADATKEADVYCVLARGWSGRSTKTKKKLEVPKETPKELQKDHIFDLESVSHQWLFPQMDVCVHHGGCGTTGASLGAGVPTIIKPFFGDQYFYGNRVEDLKCGVYLKRLTQTGLRDALLECVNNKKLIRQARIIGQQIQNEHGVEEGIIALYDELEYARSVTLERRRNTEDASDGVRYLPDSLPFKNTIDRAIQPAKRLSMLWPSLPKFGRREEQSIDRSNCGDDTEVDVSV